MSQSNGTMKLKHNIFRNEFGAEYLWVIHVVYEITLHTCESLAFICVHICNRFHVSVRAVRSWNCIVAANICTLICISFENVPLYRVIVCRAKNASLQIEPECCTADPKKREQPASKEKMSSQNTNIMEWKHIKYGIWVMLPQTTTITTATTRKKKQNYHKWTASVCVCVCITRLDYFHGHQQFRKSLRNFSFFPHLVLVILFGFEYSVRPVSAELFRIVLNHLSNVFISTH